MGDFYILNNVPSVQADTAMAAARGYALEHNIEAGEVLVARAVQKFDVTTGPRDVQVSPQ